MDMSSIYHLCLLMFIQQVFIECLLCASTAVGSKDALINKVDKNSSLHGPEFLLGREQQERKR